MTKFITKVPGGYRLDAREWRPTAAFPYTGCCDKETVGYTASYPDSLKRILYISVLWGIRIEGIYKCICES